ISLILPFYSFLPPPVASFQVSLYWPIIILVFLSLFWGHPVNRSFILYIGKHFQVIAHNHRFCDGHILHFSWFPSFVIIVEVFWQRKGNIFKHVQITGIWHPGSVSGFMTDD